MDITFTKAELISLKGEDKCVAKSKCTLVQLLNTAAHKALEKETQLSCSVSLNDIRWIATTIPKLLVGCTFEIEREKDMSPLISIIWHGVLEKEPEPSEEELLFTRLELKTMVVSQEKPATCIKVIIISFIAGVVETAVRGETRYTDTIPAAELGVILVQLMRRFPGCRIEYTQKNDSDTYLVSVIW
jgi:hypothetical protein